MAFRFPDYGRSAALGFTMGQQVGQEQNALGSFIKSAMGVMQGRVSKEREFKRDVQKFGIQEKVKAQYREPSPFNPTTREGALEFERAKSDIKKQLPEGFQEDLQTAIVAIGKTDDDSKKMRIFQRIAGIYPRRSNELKRILLPAQKETVVDIIKAINELE